MTTTPVGTWEPGWQARLLDSVRAEGAHAVTDFLARFPGEPAIQVAKRLPGNVAAVQLELLQFEEAERAGRLRDAAKDAFCRLIRDNLKRGWGRGRHAEFNTASTYADWLSLLEFRALHPELRPVGDAVWQALLQLAPPDGWLPSGSEDPLIVAAFNAGWPS